MQTVSARSSYTGKELGTSLSPSISPVSTELFNVRPPRLPQAAQPIYDEHLGACVGYSWEAVRGVWHIYDALGQKIGIEELPLEPSPVGPEDVILIGVAVVKLARGVLSVVKSGGAFQRDLLSKTVGISQRLIQSLRSRFFAPDARQLKFTQTTAKHMVNPGRFVPVQILQLALRFGKRMPDPQNIAGVFRYEVPMTRLVKRGGVYQREVKTLEVVVREADWTILHFMYF